MIKQLAQRASKHYSDRMVIDPNKQEIYSYGFELLISTTANFIVIFIISCVFGLFFEPLLFMVSFIPLRLSAGGYHAKHHWSCIVGFGSIFLLFMIFLSRINSDAWSYYSLIATFVSSVLIYYLAPVETPNKPLSYKHYVQQRNRSVTLSLIHVAIVSIDSLITHQFTELLTYYSSGTLCACLLLVAEKKKKKNTFSNDIF